MFSIIIPVGPGRDGRTALNSLRRAGLGLGDEVLVVSDGHSLDLDAEFGDLPLRVFSIIPRRGANAARNLGAREARGEILCFLDDDDAYFPGALEKIGKAIKKEPDTHAWVLNWRMKSGRSFTLTLYPKIITERKIKRRNQAGGASSMVVRKSIFKKAGGFDESFVAMQDWDLWIRLSRLTSIRRIREPLVIYNDVGRDRISTNRSTRISGLKQLLEKHSGNWGGSVEAYHRARLGAQCWKAGEGKWIHIFQKRAPLASIYFAIKILLCRR